MYPPYRRRRRTISSAGADVQMRLDTNLQSNIVNGSVHLRRSSSTSTGTNSREENSNDRRFHFTFLREEQESLSTRRRRSDDGREGHRSAPSILQRSEGNTIGTDSPDNPAGLNDEWSIGE